MITGPVARVRCAPTISSMPPGTIFCTSIDAPGNRSPIVSAAARSGGRVVQVEQNAAGIGLVRDPVGGDLERDRIADAVGGRDGGLRPVDDLLCGDRQPVGR